MQGKEVATQIKILPDGSVTFDDVSMEQFEGVIRTPVIRSFTHGRGKEVSDSVCYVSLWQNTLGSYVRVANSKYRIRLRVSWFCKINAKCQMARLSVWSFYSYCSLYNVCVCVYVYR